MTQDEFLEQVVQANEPLFLSVYKEIAAMPITRDNLLVEAFGCGSGLTARWIWDHFDLKEKVRS